MGRAWMRLKYSEKKVVERQDKLEHKHRPTSKWTRYGRLSKLISEPNIKKRTTMERDNRLVRCEDHFKTMPCL